MARIIAYQQATPDGEDLLLGTQKTTGGTNQTNPTKNFTVDAVVQAGVGYTAYTALLTQTGSAAPVATILKNNTTATLTWARTAGGTYTVTADSSIFTANKTVVFMNYGNPPSESYFPKWVRTSNTVITVTTLDEQGALNDAVLNGAAFEIRIYS